MRVWQRSADKRHGALLGSCQSAFENMGVGLSSLGLTGGGEGYRTHLSWGGGEEEVFLVCFSLCWK